MVRKKSVPNGNRSAFTLVELLVVMAAIVVLAAVTLPSLRTLLHDQKVTAAARMVKAHFESAQARAIASNRPVAVIFERNVDSTTAAENPNVVTRLAIGQVFPPYEGDVFGSVGTLVDTDGNGFFDQLVFTAASMPSLLTVTPPLFEPGDLVQFDYHRSKFVIASIDVAARTVNFGNAGLNEEAQLPVRPDPTASYRLYRKPTRSFLQTTTLPRGTCVDTSVSGMGPFGAEFASTTAVPLMVVFNEQGEVAYWTGDSGPGSPSSLMHFMVGRTEQVLPANPMSVENPIDTGSVNANLNDNANTWISINPFTGAVTSSAMQAGGEAGGMAGLSARLQASRAFATNAITQSEN